MGKAAVGERRPPRPCAECVHYRTRVFRSERDLEELLQTQIKFVIKGDLMNAYKILEQFGEVRVYWCRMRHRGPYLSESKVMRCSEYMEEEL